MTEAETHKEVGMSMVIFDLSMSLDWFIAASNRRPEEPTGDGGEKLHERAMGGDKDVAVMGGPDVGRQFIEAGLVDRDRRSRGARPAG
jgi:hypothetical protein